MKMDTIQAIVSNPIPTSIAVIVALLALVGYYFFVIPLIEEHKKLKQKLQSIEDDKTCKEGAALAEQKEQLEEIQSALGQLKTFVEVGDQGHLDKVAQVEELISKTNVFQSSSVAENKQLQLEIVEINNVLGQITKLLEEASRQAKSHDASIARTIQDSINLLHGINEKQSQIIGALLGMERMRDKNKGI